MKCPKDKNELIKEVYEDTAEIDKCSTCQGIWLDKCELEKIQETIKNDYSEELKNLPNLINGVFNVAKSKTEKEYDCPKCDKPLDKREYGYCSQVIIDLCPSCRGIWLDKEEIQKLEVFFERSRIEAKEIRKGFLGSLIGLLR